MKTLFPLFLSLLLLASCSSKHYLQNANFDTAISKSTTKIRKNPNKTKEIENLKYAYSKANQIDNDRLEFLFESGEDNIWEEVHQRYSRLNNRQDIVKTLPDNVLYEINYQESNYGKKISESKQNAAAFYYNKGIALMEKNNKLEARDAYTYFLKAKSYYPNYKDVEARASEARFYGTNHVLFRMENQSRVAIPEDFESELLKISLKDLNETWIDYDNYANENTQYDYYIQLSIKQITVSPEDTKSTSYVEEKEIESGFKYQLDQNGNVQKDTAGNDVKLPIYKIITCTVKEMTQYKEAIISGTVDYFDTSTNQLLKTHPVSAAMVFDHHSAEAFGDLNALKAETSKKVGINALPYPTDPVMIMDAASILKENTKTIIYNNKSWLAN